MMKQTILIALFFLIISFKSIESTSDTIVIRVQKVDTIYYEHFEFGIENKLALLTNGKFIHDIYSMNCIGDNSSRKKVFGKYIIHNNILTLIPKTVKLFIYPKKSDLKSKIYNWKYKDDTLNYNMVKWGRTKYLLSDDYDKFGGSEKINDFIRFANNYNAGVEPRYHGNYLVCKKGRNRHKKFDFNQIPKKWRKYFLLTPISAKIIDITKNTLPNRNPKTYVWTIIIDKGKNDSVRKGMTFGFKKDNLSFQIDSVFDTKSIGSIYYQKFDKRKYPKGTECRTKWN